MADTSSRLQAIEQATLPAAGRLDEEAQLAGPVAVLPSAFNPPTRAHFHLLAASSELLGATPAALLTTRNVDKALTGASYLQRIEMLLAARGVMPALAILAANQARIIDQAAILRQTWPQAVFAVVAGYDVLIRLFDPTYYTDMGAELAPFFEQHRLIVTNRAGHSLAEVGAFIDAHAARFAHRITLLEIDDHHASLSSSVARGHAATGEETPSLTPEVAEYVRKHGLYRAG